MCDTTLYLDQKYIYIPNVWLGGKHLMGWYEVHNLLIHSVQYRHGKSKYKTY